MRKSTNIVFGCIGVVIVLLFVFGFTDVPSSLSLDSIFQSSPNPNLRRASEIRGESDSSEPQWIEKSGSRWDAEFKKGIWDYMDAVPMERLRLAAIGSGLTRLYGVPSNGTILDVGCGEGIITEYLTEEQKMNYIGVDISKVAINNAINKRGSPMTWVVSMAHEYTPPKEVDVIIFSEVLYYVDHEKVLKQYEQYLAPNGKIIISMYCEEKQEQMYSDIRDFARSHFNLVDHFEFLGTTRNPDPTKVNIRVDVVEKKTAIKR
jgi:SAM-dependent methyltransferase